MKQPWFDITYLRNTKARFICAKHQALSAFKACLPMVTSSALKLLSVMTKRHILFACFFFTLLALLASKMVFLASHRPCSKGLQALLRKTVTPPIFTDRHGRLLAGNARTYSVYAHTKSIKNPRHTVASLCKLFPDLKKTVIEKNLTKNGGFVWIKRHITPRQRRAFLKAGLRGCFLQKEVRRVYPHKNLFCHAIGMTDIDGHGLSGLSYGLDKKITHVTTSLDLSLQHIAYCELKKYIDHFNAKAGNVLLVHIPTGEIRAMVSLPDFNPYHPHKTPAHHLFNRNLSGVYEFGSVMKIHNVAMGLEQGVTSLNQSFDTTHPLRLGHFRVSDFRGKGGYVTLHDAFVRSSNIVNARVAMAAGVNLQKAFFKKIGLFERIMLEAPETASPLLPKTWSETTLATLSYGYGMALTPLHLAQSVATLSTGFFRPLTLYKRNKPAPAKRMISKRTASIICNLLQKCASQGNARKASVSGYDVGSKTGTANLLHAGTYQKRNNRVTCVSIFPTQKPQYVLLATLDSPQPCAETFGFATAGWIAAPLAGALVKRLAPLLKKYTSNAG